MIQTGEEARYDPRCKIDANYYRIAFCCIHHRILACSSGSSSNRMERWAGVVQYV